MNNGVNMEQKRKPAQVVFPFFVSINHKREFCRTP